MKSHKFALGIWFVTLTFLSYQKGKTINWQNLKAQIQTSNSGEQEGATEESIVVVHLLRTHREQTRMPSITYTLSSTINNPLTYQRIIEIALPDVISTNSDVCIQKTNDQFCTFPYTLKNHVAGFELYARP